MKIEAFLQESPLIAVIWAARRFEGQLSRLFKDKGLNFSTALVLVSLLLEEPARVSPSQLASILCMTRANISHSISALEAAGLVVRRIDPEDARAYQLTLKPPGKKAAMQVVRVLHQMQTSFEKAAGVSQLKDFIALMKRLEQTCARLESPRG